MRSSISMFPSECTRILSQIRPNATFLTVHWYQNNFQEISDFSICFHINYLNAVKKAYNQLIDYRPRRLDCTDFTIDDLRYGRRELLKSFEQTLAGRNELATSAHAYNEVMVPPGDKITGIKLHRNQDILHLYGFFLHKRIHRPGAYPPDNRRPLTRAKDFLRKKVRIDRFRQFKLTPGKFARITVQGFTILEQDVLRESGF